MVSTISLWTSEFMGKNIAEFQRKMNDIVKDIHIIHSELENLKKEIQNACNCDNIVIVEKLLDYDKYEYDITCKICGKNFSIMETVINIIVFLKSLMVS